MHPCVLINANLNVTTIQVAETGPLCNPVISNSAVLFNLPLSSNDCGTQVVENGTHLIYTNVIQVGGCGQEEKIISRHRKIEIFLTCAMQIGPYYKIKINEAYNL